MDDNECDRSLVTMILIASGGGAVSAAARGVPSRDYWRGSETAPVHTNDTSRRRVPRLNMPLPAPGSQPQAQLASPARTAAGVLPSAQTTGETPEPELPFSSMATKSPPPAPGWRRSRDFPCALSAIGLHARPPVFFPLRGDSEQIAPHSPRRYDRNNNDCTTRRALVGFVGYDPTANRAMPNIRKRSLPSYNEVDGSRGCHPEFNLQPLKQLRKLKSLKLIT